MIGRELFERNLESAVKNLAAPADIQIGYLHEIGLDGLADELALQLDDVIGRVDQAVEDHILSERTAASLKALDEILIGFSGEVNASLWTTEALRVRPEWSAVRLAAQEALRNVENDFRQRDRG